MILAVEINLEMRGILSIYMGESTMCRMLDQAEFEVSEEVH